MRALFDVNVLIALLDAAHIHHSDARRWLTDNGRGGWASCPITQLGCVRIMSHRSYANPQPASQVAARLRAAADHSDHQFWSAGVDLIADRPIDWSGLLSSRQVTDVYLLSLAVAHKGRLVTFDGGVASHLVAGAAARHLVVIASAGGALSPS